MYEELTGSTARRFLDGIVLGAKPEKVHPDNRAQVAQRISELVARIGDRDVLEYERKPWMKILPGRWQVSRRSPLSFTQVPVAGMPRVGQFEDGTLYLYAEPGNAYGKSGFRYIGMGAQIAMVDGNDALYLKFSGTEPRALAVAHEVIIIPRYTVHQMIEQCRREAIGFQKPKY